MDLRYGITKLNEIKFIGDMKMSRHKVFTNIAYALLYPYSLSKYGIYVEPIKEKRQYLILYNHQTAFDQFFGKNGKNDRTDFPY